MAEIIRMPKMSDTMEEGVITTWLKTIGDVVQSGDILAEVETDKATMELEADQEGVLLHIGVPAKQAVPVNEVLAIIGEKNEDITHLLQKIQQPEPIAATTEQVVLSTLKATSNSAPTAYQATTQPSKTSNQPTPAHPTSQRVFASPLAKKIAQDKGYDLAAIQGTGEQGRIIKRDIINFVPGQDPSTSLPKLKLPAISGEEAYEEVPVSQMRKTIARRLLESQANIPHFCLTIQVNMDQMMAAKPSINQYAPIKVTLNDIIIKATAVAIKQHPAVNAAWLDNMIRYNKHIHVGVAMAVAEGILVPIVRFADHQSLAQVAATTQDLRQKAHSNQLLPQDCTGNTFTISNLGMLGIETFQAMINPPAACILAIGEVKQVPVVKAHKIIPGYVMKATLSCDHRTIDGAIGANFLKTWKELLEDPLRLLVYG